MKRLAVTLVAATVLVGCGGSAEDDAADATPTPTEILTEIEQAVDDCAGRTRDPNIYDADDGQTLIIDGIGQDDGASGTAMADHQNARECIFNRLDMTEAIRSRVGNTRALDGTQDGSWDNYEATWTFHPDNGLDVIVERVDEGAS